MFTLLFAAIVSLLALFAGFWAWNRFTVSGNISALTESGDRFECTASGKAKCAHDRLVKMGRKALPALRLRNEQLIAEHAAYREALMTGPSWNPYENYGLRSDEEKAYRIVIEVNQARVVDVIRAIEGPARSSQAGVT